MSLETGEFGNMIDFSESVMKSVYEELSKDEKNALSLAKSIMDKMSGYYINEKNAELADFFRSISALLSNMEAIYRNGN